jgi:CelD/BcsL family acetyltransferase involved in cellulose biosynthesis
MKAEMIDDVARLDALREEWDALAVAARLPFSSPAWQLSWWRHAAPEGAALRAVAVFDGDRLVGLSPFYALRAQYRLLAAPTADRIAPLACTGGEADVAALVARALSRASPRPAVVTLRGLPVGSQWPQLLAESWPGRRAVRDREPSVPAYYIALAGSTFDEWFASRSSNVRKSVQRRRRRLAEAGTADVRLSGAESELERDLGSFAALHYSRWEHRGGSAVLTPAVERMLLDAGRGLLAGLRFRLTSVDLDGRTIASQVVIAAGGEASHWLNGFDDAFAAYAPAIEAALQTVEDAFERGDGRLDLGGGDQIYKRELATGEETLETTNVIPGWQGRVRLAPRRLRQGVSTRLSDRQRRVVKRLLPL